MIFSFKYIESVTTSLVPRTRSHILTNWCVYKLYPLGVLFLFRETRRILYQSLHIWSKESQFLLHYGAHLFSSHYLTLDPYSKPHSLKPNEAASTDYLDQKAKRHQMTSLTDPRTHIPRRTSPDREEPSAVL
jgi:hypothetical protein